MRNLRSATDYVVVVDDGAAEGWSVRIYPSRGEEPIEVPRLSEEAADELAGAVRDVVRAAQREAIEAAIDRLESAYSYWSSVAPAWRPNALDTLRGEAVLLAERLPAKDGG